SSRQRAASPGLRHAARADRFCDAAGVLILCAVAGGSATARALSVRPLVFLGQISYSVYLWHLPFLVAFAGCCIASSACVRSPRPSRQGSSRRVRDIWSSCRASPEAETPGSNLVDRLRPQLWLRRSAA